MAIGLLLAFILPSFVFASGAAKPLSVYESYRIKRSMAHIFLDDSSDYYSYLLGDELDPIAFYMAYRYFQNKPLSKSQISDLERIFKHNGDYINDPDSNYYRLSDEAYENWQKERDLVMNDGFAYGQENNSDKYSDSNIILNDNICPFGTFENAAKLLLEKKKTLDTDALNAWIDNQDKIFLNCFEPRGNWRNRLYDKPQITCDDRKLQEGLPTLSEEKSKKGFWGWLKSVLLFREKEDGKEAVLLDNDSYALPFNSKGLIELEQDEEMQNALYYYYKAKREDLCSNVAGDLFKKVADNPEHPHRANATVGYIRTLIRDSGGYKNASKDILEKINGYLKNEDPSSISGILQIEKEKILSYLYNPAEFIKAQEGLKNPSANFIHDAAIFYQQYELFAEKYRKELPSEEELARHSELVRFLYYWNFEKPNLEWIGRVYKERISGEAWDLWLTLLLKGVKFEPQYGSDFIEVGINVEQKSTKLYYPIHYYAYSGLLGSNKTRAIVLSKVRLTENIPDIAYNYFADLIMKNAETLDEAVEFMSRRSAFIAHRDTIDYAFEKTKNRTLESVLDEAGWRDDETGRRYYYRFIDKAIETPSDDDFLSFINFGAPLDYLYSNTTLMKKFKSKIFTRAFVLGRDDIYVPLLSEFSINNPILAQAKAANSSTTRDFLISYAILNNLNNGQEDFFGISIHNSNYNVGENLNDWQADCSYCPTDYYNSSWLSEGRREEYKKRYKEESLIAEEKTKPFRKFLTEDKIKKAAEENKILGEKSLVQIFGEHVLAYMEINPRDSRIPEALSLLVKRMRRWHSRADGNWAKKIFQTLHYEYPDSRWTKDTSVYW